MRLIFCSKTFAHNKGISHVGLGVSGLNTCKVLRNHNVHAEIWQVPDYATLEKKLAHAKHDSHKITHVVIAALWIPTSILNRFCAEHPHIEFAVNCHSNVGFLQADPTAVKLLREGMALEMGVHNFKVAANSEKMQRWVIRAYGHPCAYLPNLYYLNGVEKHHRMPWHYGQTLRIGCFGAIRPQKNLATSIAAAIQIGHELRVKTEIYISSGRVEGGIPTVLSTVREMCHGLPTTTLHESGWQGWPEFRRLIGTMNLCLQPSYTESMNLVTADAIAEGVASVTSDAITWVPDYWKARADETCEVAHTGRMLLLNHHAPADGLRALETYIEHGVKAWKKYLGLSH